MNPIITSTKTVAEALSIIEAHANQPKRGYIRVGDRKYQERHAIAGMPTYILVIHTTVYSKTWSRNTARIWDMDTLTELTTKAAKKLLSAEITKGTAGMEK